MTVLPKPSEPENEQPLLQRSCSAISHHVKNPLAGIAGALKILASRLQMPATEAAVVAEILTRLDELNDSLDDLSAFSRDHRPKKVLISAARLVNEVAAETARKGFSHLEVQVPDAEVRLHGDPALLRRAVSSLVRNAHEAVPKDGKVVVVVAEDGAFATIEVRDNGGGVETSALERLFEPFYTTKARHLGLGLPIAHRILRAHGGGVTCLHSDGSGTSMQMRLPLHRE